MRILLEPMLAADDDRIVYTFTEDTITAEYKGVVDTFDFSGLPEGEATFRDIETDLALDPIYSVRRTKDGIEARLINLLGVKHTEAEAFPEWIEHTAYVAPEPVVEEPVTDEPIPEPEIDEPTEDDPAQQPDEEVETPVESSSGTQETDQTTETADEPTTTDETTKEADNVKNKVEK